MVPDDKLNVVEYVRPEGIGDNGKPAKFLETGFWNGEAGLGTAWYMLRRIRQAWGDNELAEFVGPVEVDETYIGDKDRETNQAKAKVIKNTDKKTLQRFVVGPVPSINSIRRRNPGILGVPATCPSYKLRPAQKPRPFRVI